MRERRDPSDPHELSVAIVEDSQIDIVAVAMEVARLADELVELKRRNGKLQGLLEVAKQFGAEHEIDRLLDIILEEAKRVTGADRCSLFIADKKRGELWAKIAQGMGGKRLRIPIGQGIAGQCAETCEPIHIPDAYADPRFNPDVDKQSGYRTRNILAVPMIDDIDECRGVIQALNKSRGRPFDAEDQEMLMALGAVAAVAIENAILHRDIQRLFEGFIRASVYAIEARDPTTSGHSERVALLSVGTAEALNRHAPELYRGVHLDDAELRELRYAALLHDFGKVGVRENVLVKANKLYPHELDLLESRFECARMACRHDHDQRRIDALSPRGLDDEAASLLRQIAEAESRTLQELDEFWAFVLQCNRPTVLEQGGFDRLQELARHEFALYDGRRMPLLGAGELKSLSIPRGTLTDEERRQIEDHVVHTYNFLRQIPWTRDLQNVPDIAHRHHEKLNGRGYPKSLGPEAIPVQARIMTIVDIYDALTARDRPYKSAVPHDRAMQILGFEAEAGAICPQLLQLFHESEPWRALESQEVEGIANHRRQPSGGF
ncbi:MAG: hypothetical protein RIT45_525 [Pseudomonadota bacterium]|jgi:HD-GYP domain-containing protein (c-di-GMP phosphodiesterase class II)